METRDPNLTWIILDPTSESRKITQPLVPWRDLWDSVRGVNFGLGGKGNRTKYEQKDTSPEKFRKRSPEHRMMGAEDGPASFLKWHRFGQHVCLFLGEVTDPYSLKSSWWSLRINDVGGSDNQPNQCEGLTTDICYSEDHVSAGW